jgi:transposase
VEEIIEDAEVVTRVAALDIGKASLVACVRVPHEDKPGRRCQEVRTFATTTAALLELRDWLACQGVVLCVMEATSTYWKPPSCLLEDAVECWLVNARDVKNVPGRAKTGRLDAAWLCKLAERGMLRPSFVPPPWQRDLRDLCRYRRILIQERTRDKQRAEKLLESAAIKISAVVSDLHGVTGRDIMDHLIGGERNPRVLAQLARTAARRKITELEQALEGAGFFTAGHAGLLTVMLERIDRVTADITRLSEVIEQLLAPYEEQLQQAESMPGWRRRSAQDAIAETGVDMTRFPTGAHLASWGSRAPLDHQSGTRKGRARSKKGNRYLAGVLGETAVAAGRTQTREGARYRRLARRLGKPKAQVAVGNTQLKVLHKLLSSPGMRYEDLGADYYERRASLRRQIRHHLTQLESPGFDVTLCRTPDPQPGPAGQAHAI